MVVDVTPQDCGGVRNGIPSVDGCIGLFVIQVEEKRLVWKVGETARFPGKERRLKQPFRALGAGMLEYSNGIQVPSSRVSPEAKDST